MIVDAPTEPQLAYVTALTAQLRLTTPLLDRHCCDTFGRPFATLDRRQMSRLIDELKGWKTLPAHLQRLQGQLELPL